MGSDLNYPVGLIGHIDHPASLADGHRERFFDIDILPGLTGIDGLKRVPMIRGGEHDPVDIVPVEDFSIVFVDIHFS